MLTLEMNTPTHTNWYQLADQMFTGYMPFHHSANMPMYENKTYEVKDA